MDLSLPPAEEFRIASYLAPHYSGVDQTALLAYLLNNPHALEVMCMALEALAAINYERPIVSSPASDTA